jgi:exodeoxyribonuclease-3
MKLYSFNVNGIRSAISKGLISWVQRELPDILCLQEIKLSETNLVEPLFEELGYHSFWFPAQKKGYSGVAILSRTKPENVEYGIKNDFFDTEGRVISAIYNDFKVINAYFPSGTTGDIRQSVKMEFLDEMHRFMQKQKEEHRSVILCGDVNICHKEIDIHNPAGNKKSSGFLPEERAWVSQFIESGFDDTFRLFNSEPHQYSWWSYRAGSRGNNKGWRIDYFFVSPDLKDRLAGAKIHSDIVMSDHCPISLTLRV